MIWKSVTMIKMWASKLLLHKLQRHHYHLIYFMVISALKEEVKCCSETFLKAFYRRYFKQELPARPHGVMTQKTMSYYWLHHPHISFMVISALKKDAKCCSETLLTAFYRHYLGQKLPARPHGVMTQKTKIWIIIDFITIIIINIIIIYLSSS